MNSRNKDNSRINILIRMKSCDNLFYLLPFFPKKTYYIKFFVIEIFSINNE